MTQRVARIMQKQGAQRDRLCEGTYMSSDPDDPLVKLEKAYRATLAADKVGVRIKDAIRRRELPRLAPITLLDEALEKGIINENDVAIVCKAEELRTDAITVDSFSESEYLATALDGGW
jgi:acyl-CoA dehydrogenase